MRRPRYRWLKQDKKEYRGDADWLRHRALTRAEAHPATQQLLQAAAEHRLPEPGIHPLIAMNEFRMKAELRRPA